MYVLATLGRVQKVLNSEKLGDRVEFLLLEISCNSLEIVGELEVYLPLKIRVVNPRLKGENSKAKWWPTQMKIKPFEEYKFSFLEIMYRDLMC